MHASISFGDSEIAATVGRVSAVRRASRRERVRRLEIAATEVKTAALQCAPGSGESGDWKSPLR